MSTRGRIAMVGDPVHGEQIGLHLGINSGGCWHIALDDGELRCLAVDAATSVRPLVVIDPGFGHNPAAVIVAALRQAAENDCEVETLLSWLADQIAEQTEPPKPEEPTGKYAEVESGEGTTYYRSPAGTWHRATDNFERPWDHIGAVLILSEGVR